MPDNEKKLYYLDEMSGYKVADGDCDVRGWKVADADGRYIGTVDGLLVNKEAERVVYLDVEVNEELREAGRQTYGMPVSDGAYEFSNKDGDDHLVIPVGLVDLDEENETVMATNIRHETFAKAARFRKGAAINREYEITLMRHLIPTMIVDEPSSIGDHFYKGGEFENKLSRRKH